MAIPSLKSLLKYFTKRQREIRRVLRLVSEPHHTPPTLDELEQELCDNTDTPRERVFGALGRLSLLTWEEMRNQQMQNPHFPVMVREHPETPEQNDVRRDILGVAEYEQAPYLPPVEEIEYLNQESARPDFLETAQQMARAMRENTFLAYAGTPFESEFDREKPRECYSCKRKLNFGEVCEANKQIDRETLKKYWLDDRIQLYCCSCYALQSKMGGALNNPTTFQLYYGDDLIDCEIRNVHITWQLPSPLTIDFEMALIDTVIIDIHRDPNAYPFALKLQISDPSFHIEIDNLYMASLHSILSHRGNVPALMGVRLRARWQQH